MPIVRDLPLTQTDEAEGLIEETHSDTTVSPTPEPKEEILNTPETPR
jgi:hypothetical protein